MTTIARPALEEHSGERRPHLSFRPDVEGLRAVAVLLVMASHAGISIFAGGYVGVDVFFVISGFLITRMLVGEIHRTGRLDLGRFYARRMRRLLPGSMVVLLGAAALTAVLLPASRWKHAGLDIGASSTYLVNWEFSLRSLDYLHADGPLSIVQHFWSLAVEEQFYIVWPLLLVTAARTARGSTRNGLDRTMLIALIMVCVPSLAWSIYYTEVHAPMAYFVSSTRLWELAVGALVAMASLRGVSLPKRLTALTGWIGIVAIVVAAVTFTADTRFPGYHALLPTLGAAALIAAGLGVVEPGPASASRLLSIGPMQAIGRYSYSLYLCHWPLVVVATVLLGTLSATTGTLVVASSAVPAVLLYHFVENPVRHASGPLRNTATALKAGAVAMIIPLIAGSALYLAGSRNPEPIPLTQVDALKAGDATISAKTKADPFAILGAGLLDDQPLGDPKGQARNRYPVIVPAPRFAQTSDTDHCARQGWDEVDPVSCVYGAVGARTVVAVVGDSHAAHWEAAMDEIGKARGWEIHQYTKLNCEFTTLLMAKKDGYPYSACATWAARVLQRLIEVDRPITVIVAEDSEKSLWLDGRPQSQADPQVRAILAKGLRESLSRLNDAAIPAIVIQDTPILPFDLAECAQLHPDELLRCATPRAVALPPGLGDEMRQAVAGLATSRIVDLNDAICPGDPCPAVVGNVLILRDRDHLTHAYAHSLAPRLNKLIGPTG